MGIEAVNNRVNIKKLARVAVLAAMAVALYYVELSIFVATPAPFLKLDFACVPVIVAGIVAGFPSAVASIFIANLIHFLTAGHTMGVGELANMVIGMAVAWHFAVFGRWETFFGRILQSLIAIASMVAVGLAFNFSILLPFYGISDDKVIMSLMPWIVLFNVIKGVVLTVIVALLPKSMLKWLKSE